MSNQTLPLLGICAYSGTGKTTLLTSLLPLLKSKGFRVAVVKHTHHNMDIDKPGKDSHRLRASGASQVLLASRNRIAWIEERVEQNEEPKLCEVISALNPDTLDLVLVEGFKGEIFPKIELYRPSLGKPLIHPGDSTVIAVATDEDSFPVPEQLSHLDLNSPEQICQYIIEHIIGWQDKLRAASGYQI